MAGGTPGGRQRARAPRSHLWEAGPLCPGKDSGAQGSFWHRDRKERILAFRNVYYIRKLIHCARASVTKNKLTRSFGTSWAQAPPASARLGRREGRARRVTGLELGGQARGQGQGRVPPHLPRPPPAFCVALSCRRYTTPDAVSSVIPPRGPLARGLRNAPLPSLRMGSPLHRGAGLRVAARRPWRAARGPARAGPGQGGGRPGELCSGPCGLRTRSGAASPGGGGRGPDASPAASASPPASCLPWGPSLPSPALHPPLNPRTA